MSVLVKFSTVTCLFFLLNITAQAKAYPSIDCTFIKHVPYSTNSEGFEVKVYGKYNDKPVMIIDSLDMGCFHSKSEPLARYFASIRKMKDDNYLLIKSYFPKRDRVEVIIAQNREMERQSWHDQDKSYYEAKLIINGEFYKSHSGYCGMINETILDSK